MTTEWVTVPREPTEAMVAAGRSYAVPSHTEGPWKTCLPDETLIFGADGNQVATTWQGRDDYDINCERRAADAHLIAAAPDLYEALYDLVAVCEKQPRISKSFPDPGSPLGKARSALAKARGEA